MSSHWIVSVACLVGLCGVARAQTFKYQSFKPAGAKQTIFALVNSRGDVVGTYYDDKFVQHGFFRSAGGVVFSVDPPSSTGTVASGIDGAGCICGYFGDKEGAYHGFVRKSRAPMYRLMPQRYDTDHRNGDEFYGQCRWSISRCSRDRAWIPSRSEWHRHLARRAACTRHGGDLNQRCRPDRRWLHRYERSSARIRSRAERGIPLV